MKDVVLYIAMSLDGYLADRDGGVAWLGGDGSDPENQGSYQAFYETVDTVVMGHRTYRQITEELSPGNWVYGGKTCYVVTHRPQPSTREVRFTDRSPQDLVRDLRRGDGGSIWVCGGASLANQLMGAGLIDEFWISVIPTLLGGGIRLFGPLERPQALTLAGQRSYNGITDLVYRRRGGPAQTGCLTEGNVL